jgi:hypothetical protein
MPQEGYPNLVGPGDRSPDEARAASAKGGVKSGESRRKKKTFAEGLRAILDMPARDPETLEALKALGLDGTVRDVLNLAQIRNAEKGDVDAFRLVRDTVGEKPREGLEIGNLADRPFETLDLTKMSDEQLRELAAMKSDSHE